MSKSDARLLFIGILVIFCVIAYMVATVTPSGNEAGLSQSVKPEAPIQVGQVAYLGNEGKEVIFFYQNAYLPDSGIINCNVLLPNWLTVKVLQHRVHREGYSIPYSEVEVLEGPFKAMTGFVRSDWLHSERRQPPDMTLVTRIDHKPTANDPCPIGYN